MIMIDRMIEQALLEDIHTGDITTKAVVPQRRPAEARLIAKEDLVVAGLSIAGRVFSRLDPDVVIRLNCSEGDHLAKGTVMATLSGDAADLLMGERVALNLLQRMCGIATLTSRFVAAVSGTKARIVDTRKTTPGLREIEKYAVRIGGGINHRTGLYDGVLIKENHIAAAGGITEAIRRARAYIPHTLKIEIETETLEQVDEALAAGADIIMLDNMTLDQMRKAVAVIAGRAVVEASGGVNLETVRGIAETGVDIISVGALTHSPRAMDISMLLD
ncbi:MAG: nicotinate-nucleotide diphosphorylase (carboxylating) [Geobacteraceae bacterium GWC2_55_20]|nr:MAG: nicotinate-nucleotide diphosphorylase (carboxylating) [Geobacteraceae bacterium GWC2_55_20]OGU20799.1 MAG: nicotinate-nucleotide diphosphorylase (carboxylating) [Geobacteraceae bacterium GWF2_54_21]HBA72362.1 carboxylating nicotinate-nucleotide diphosphorylase [Geobacter sp.]HCE67432.1 carboxylating nicotinate-nucleotide diphosphorylase [Geobacter sp.]